MVAEFDARRRVVVEGSTAAGIRAATPRGFYAFPIFRDGLEGQAARQALLQEAASQPSGTRFRRIRRRLYSSLLRQFDEKFPAPRRIGDFLKARAQRLVGSGVAGKGRPFSWILSHAIVYTRGVRACRANALARRPASQSLCDIRNSARAISPIACAPTQIRPTRTFRRRRGGGQVDRFACGRAFVAESALEAVPQRFAGAVMAGATPNVRTSRRSRPA